MLTDGIERLIGGQEEGDSSEAARDDKIKLPPKRLLERSLSTENDNHRPVKKVKTHQPMEEEETRAAMPATDEITIVFGENDGERQSVTTGRCWLAERSTYFASLFEADINKRTEVHFNDVSVPAFLRAWSVVEDPSQELGVEDAAGCFPIFQRFGFLAGLQKSNSTFFEYGQQINDLWRVSERKQEGLGLQYGPEKEAVWAAIDPLIWIAHTSHSAGLECTQVTICLLAKLLCHPEKGVLFSQAQIKELAPLMPEYPVLIEPFGLSPDLVNNDLFPALLQSKLCENEIFEGLVRKWKAQQSN